MLSAIKITFLSCLVRKNFSKKLKKRLSLAKKEVDASVNFEKIKMGKPKNLVGKSRTLTAEESKELVKDTHKRMFEGKGPMSGTDVCECNGKVEYTAKRSDGAELGSCQECGKIYIDPKGHRLPHPYDSQTRINSFRF